MTHWSRVRRVPVLAVGIFALAGLTLVARDGTVVVPSPIGGGSATVLWSTFLPVAWATLLACCLDQRGSDIEATAVARLAVLDVALVAGATSLAVLVLVAASDQQSAAVQMTAHVLVSSGAALLGTALVHARFGVLAVTMLMLLTFSYGVSMPAARQVRVLQPDGDPGWSLAVGTALLVLAVAAMLRWQRPPLGQTRW